MKLLPIIIIIMLNACGTDEDYTTPEEYGCRVTEMEDGAMGVECDGEEVSMVEDEPEEAEELEEGQFVCKADEACNIVIVRGQ